MAESRGSVLSPRKWQGLPIVCHDLWGDDFRICDTDKEDQFTNIILGFDRFEDYVDNSPKYGASIGPVAGRIAGASFELNGQTYRLEANNGANCNHSGPTGWDSTLFSVESVTDQEITLYTERQMVPAVSLEISRSG